MHSFVTSRQIIHSRNLCARPNHQARAKKAGVLKIWMEPEPLIPTWDTLETYRRLRQLAEQSGERSRSRSRSPRRRRSFSRSQSRDSAAGAGGGSSASNLDWKAAQLRNWRDQQVRSKGTNLRFAVLGIRDIFGADPDPRICTLLIDPNPAPDSDSTPDPTPFFIDLKDAKKYFFFSYFF